MRALKKKMKKSMAKPYVGHVVKIMHQMNFGFAVTSVRSGSMVSVLRSPLQELSILSSTNARHAAIRELALEMSNGSDMDVNIQFYSLNEIY